MTNNNEVFTITDADELAQAREAKRLENAMKRLAECFKEREAQLQALKDLANRFHDYAMNEDVRGAVAQIEGFSVLSGDMEMTKTQIKIWSKKISEQ